MHFGLVICTASLYLECGFEEPLELNESELIGEDLTVKKQHDDFAVLEHAWFALAEAGENESDLGLVVFAEREGSLHGELYNYKSY